MPSASSASSIHSPLSSSSSPPPAVDLHLDFVSTVPTARPGKCGLCHEWIAKAPKGATSWDSYVITLPGKSRKLYVHQRCVQQNHRGLDIASMDQEDKRRHIRDLVSFGSKHECHECHGYGATLCCKRTGCTSMYHRKCVPHHLVERQEEATVVISCDQRHSTSALLPTIPHAAFTSATVSAPLSWNDDPSPVQASGLSFSPPLPAPPPAPLPPLTGIDEAPSSNAIITASTTTSTFEMLGNLSSAPPMRGVQGYEGSHVVALTRAQIQSLKQELLDCDIGHLDLAYKVQILNHELQRFQRAIEVVRVIMIGNCNNGKTTTCNLVLYITAKDDHSYTLELQVQRRQPEYQLEALTDPGVHELTAVLHEAFRMGRTVERSSTRDGADKDSKSEAAVASAAPASTAAASRPSYPPPSLSVNAAPSTVISTSSTARAKGAPVKPLMAEWDEALSSQETDASTGPDMRHDPIPSSSNFPSQDPLMTALLEGYIRSNQGSAPVSVSGAAVVYSLHVKIHWLRGGVRRSLPGEPTVEMELTEAGQLYLGSKERKSQYASKWDVPLRSATEQLPPKKSIEPWLLWSADEGKATTAHIFRMRFAHLWHASIVFVSKELAQEMAYTYVDQMKQLYAGELEAEDKDTKDTLLQFKQRYDNLVGMPLGAFDWSRTPMLSKEQVQRMVKRDLALTHSDKLKAHYKWLVKQHQGQPLPSLLAAADVPLRKDIVPFLDQVLLLRGRGEDFFADRDFVRRQLRFWCCLHAARHCITFCTVYAPCRVLEGLELWDTPGTNEEDPVKLLLMQQALMQADVLIVLLNKALDSEKATRDELLSSHILHRKVASAEEFGYAAFLHCTEKTEQTSLVKLSRDVAVDQEDTKKKMQRRDRRYQQQKTSPPSSSAPPSHYSPAFQSTPSDIDSCPSSPSSSSSDPSDALEELDDSRRDIMVEASGLSVGRRMRRATRESVSQLLTTDSSLEEPLSDEDLSEVLRRRMSFQKMYPMLFTSMLLQQWGDTVASSGSSSALSLSSAPSDPTPSAFVSASAASGSVPHQLVQAERDAVMEYTRGYELCGLFRSLVPLLCEQQLRRFSDTQDRVVFAPAILAIEPAEDNDAAEEQGLTSDSGDLVDNSAERTSADEEDDDELPKAGFRLGDAVSVFSTPMSPSDTSSHGIQRLCDSTGTMVEITADGFVYGVLSHIAQFVEQHEDAQSGSTEVYEQLREAVCADRFKGLLSDARKWGPSLTTTMVDVAKETSRGLQERWLEQLLGHFNHWERGVLAREKQVAIRLARRGWSTASSSLRLHALDPSYRGQSNSTHLRREIFGHFTVIGHLHVRELHDALADGWQEIFEAFKEEVFEPALRGLFPAELTDTAEFRSTVERICEHALRVPFMQRWQSCLHGNDGRSRAQHIASELSSDRLLLQMSRICKAECEGWLEDNWKKWKRQWKHGRSDIVREVHEDIEAVLHNVVSFFAEDVAQRVIKNSDYFFNAVLFDGMRSVFAEAVLHFVKEMKHYDPSAADPAVLHDKVKAFMYRLARWDEQTRQLLMRIRAMDAGTLGKELVSTVQRSRQYSRWVQQSTLTQQLADALSAAQSAARHSAFEWEEWGVLEGDVQHMHEQWQADQHAAAMVGTSGVKTLCALFNRALKASKAGLAIKLDDYDPRDEPIARSLYDSMSISLLSGCSSSRMDDVEPEDVVNLVAILRSRVSSVVSAPIEKDRAVVDDMLHAYGTQDAGAVAESLGDGRLHPTAHVLQLLASFLSCHILVWSLNKETTAVSCQLVRPQHGPRSLATASAGVVHLAFLPITVEQKDAQTSDKGTAVGPFLLVPLFDAVVRFDSSSKGGDGGPFGGQRTDRQGVGRVVQIANAFTPQVQVPQRSTRKRLFVPTPTRRTVEAPTGSENTGRAEKTAKRRKQEEA